MLKIEEKKVPGDFSKDETQLQNLESKQVKP